MADNANRRDAAQTEIVRELELDRPCERRSIESNRRLRLTTADLDPEGVVREALAIIRSPSAVLELAADLERPLSVRRAGTPRRRVPSACPTRPLELELSALMGFVLMGDFDLVALRTLASNESVEVVQACQAIGALGSGDDDDD